MGTIAKAETEHSKRVQRRMLALVTIIAIVAGYFVLPRFDPLGDGLWSGSPGDRAWALLYFALVVAIGFVPIVAIVLAILDSAIRWCRKIDYCQTCGARLGALDNSPFLTGIDPTSPGSVIRRCKTCWTENAGTEDGIINALTVVGGAVDNLSSRFRWGTNVYQGGDYVKVDRWLRDRPFLVERIREDAH